LINKIIKREENIQRYEHLILGGVEKVKIIHWDIKIRYGQEWVFWGFIISLF
jgi:hypothetical protein